MKKVLAVLATLVAAMVCQPAQAEWQPDMASPVAEDIPEDVTNTGGIDIQSIEDRFQVTLYDVKLTPKGGKDLYDPEVVRIASGILDAAKVSGNKKVKSEYVAEGRVNGDSKLTFIIANYAKTAGVPVVEHLWGIGKSKDDDRVKYLVLNPDSSWVIYDKTSSGGPDLETLAISILMCPNGAAVPLKSLGKGKLKQGKHPELADACPEQGVESYPAVR